MRASAGIRLHESVQKTAMIPTPNHPHHGKTPPAGTRAVAAARRPPHAARRARRTNANVQRTTNAA